MRVRYWGRPAILLAGALTAFSAAWADPLLPSRAGAVVDAADIIRPNQEQALAAKAANLKSQSNIELVVVTLPSLQGYSIERWGRDLGNGWRVGGSASRGVLLIVAPNDREMRIEVGDGLASMLSDRQASSIIDNVIIPQFRSGEMSGGILAGADAITITLGGVETDFQLSRRERVGQWLKQWAAPLLFGVMILVFLTPILLSRGRREQGERYYRNSNGGWVYVDHDDDDGNSGRSFRSDNDRSSGGRSGGGRSFGGRGASGRW